MNIFNSNSSVSTPLLAAICTDIGSEADHIIDQVVENLLAQSRNVVGLRQRDTQEYNSGCAARLHCIESGRQYRITQSLGSQSQSCNLDVEALEQVAHDLATRLSGDMDLVVVNRFGKRESTGKGFCSVIEQALELQIPLLTVVNSDWLSCWQEYGAAYVTTVPASLPEVLAWCQATFEKRLSKSLQSAPRDTVQRSA